MNIAVAITFISRGIRVQRKGSFQKRGRTPDMITADWIAEIKKEMDVDGLISVIVNGKEDITDLVREKLKG